MGFSYELLRITIWLKPAREHQPTFGTASYESWGLDLAKTSEKCQSAREYPIVPINPTSVPGLFRVPFVFSNDSFLYDRHH